uniref:Uncharacterized protein n=1 Tax=Oryza nivara TaxID=4536 RepID=A0A0E0I743_ORYNI
MGLDAEQERRIYDKMQGAAGARRGEKKGKEKPKDGDWVVMGKFTGRWAKLELQSKMQSESSSSTKVEL